MTPGQPKIAKAPPPDPANLSAAELSSNEEAKVIPWFRGTRNMPVTWISPLYNIKARKISGDPGKRPADPAAANLVDKGTTIPTATIYHASIAGVICIGPLDEFVAISVNGGTVWPTRKLWADGVIDIPTTSRKRTANIVRVNFASINGLSANNKFVISGFADTSFNEATPTVITDAGNNGIKYANAGANVALTTDEGGLLTKVIHYELNEIRRDGAGVWKCKLAHDGIPSARPPNSTYWDSYTTTRGVNPFQFTVDGFGTGYLYWGTTDQVLDTVGEQILSQNGHPPYRRQALIVLVDWNLGQHITAPNIAILGRSIPVQDVITGAAADLDSDGQCNLMAAMAEMLRDPVVGIGQPLALPSGWQAVADDLAGNNVMTYASPYIDNALSFRAFIATAMSYFDGWMRFNTDGAMEAGHFLHNAAPPAFTDDTTIDFNDCIDEIEWRSELWAKTINETIVTFHDMLRAYKDAARKYISTFNRQVVGEPRSQTLERPWIGREDQAALYAAEWGKIVAQQQLGGTLIVTVEKATFINQGDLFLLTHDAVFLSVICRCVQKDYSPPPSARVIITFESERGSSDIPFAPTGTGRTGTVAPGIEVINRFSIIQSPSALTGDAVRILVLCARANDSLLGMRLWMLQSDLTNFARLGQQTHFAVFGTLSQNFAVNGSSNDDTSENLQLNLDEFTTQSDLDGVMTTQTQDAIDDDTLLVFVIKASDPTVYEIMTMMAIRLNAGVYKLKVRRARFGTLQMVHSTGDLCYIIYRSDLVSYIHNRFYELATNADTATFRLQGFTEYDEGDLADTNQCPDENFTFHDIHAPVVTWNIFQKFAVGDSDYADIAAFTTIFTNTTKFRFGFSSESPSDVIRKIELIARLGGRTITLYTQNILPQRLYNLISPPFTLTDGTWELFAVTTETSGRVTYSRLNTSGSDRLLLVGSATKVQSPRCDPPGGGVSGPGNPFGTGVLVTLSCPTAGAKIWWTVSTVDHTPLWTGTGGGAWIDNSVTPLTGIGVGYPGEAFTVDRVSLLLVGQKAANTDSEVVRYEFWYKSS